MQAEPKYVTSPAKRGERVMDLSWVRTELALARKDLYTLYAALDSVENGLLILNEDLRATYSNQSLPSYLRFQIQKRFAKLTRRTATC